MSNWWSPHGESASEAMSTIGIMIAYEERDLERVKDEGQRRWITQRIKNLESLLFEIAEQEQECVL